MRSARLDGAIEAWANLDFEHRLLMPDGSVRSLHVLARAVKTSSGALEYVGAVTDVTVAKQAEKTLRESTSSSGRGATFQFMLHGTVAAHV